MKIVDAVWEKRNIGVECKECNIDSGDNYHLIEKTINELKDVEYVVVRIPSDRIDVVMQFEKHGYHFIEAAIKLVMDLNNIKFPSNINSIISKVSWNLMNDGDIQNLYSEIDKNIFKTDRVILDPFFSPKLAARRYKYWAMDLIEQGCMPYKVLFDDTVVGFFINKEIKSGVYDGLLAGAYENYEGSGMGVCVQYAGIGYAKTQSAKKYIGHVSSNNAAVLRSLNMLGYRIKSIEYIMIKHN